MRSGCVCTTRVMLRWRRLSPFPAASVFPLGHITLSAPPLTAHMCSFHHTSRVWRRAAHTASSSKPPDSTHTNTPTSPTATTARKGSLTGVDATGIPVFRVVTHVLRHLWPAGEPKYRALVVASVWCVILAKVLKVAVPFWFKMIVDALTPGCVATGALTAVGPWQLGVFGLVTAYGISRLTNSISEELKSALFAPVGAHASTMISMEMFRKLHSLDLKFHMNRETGVLSKDLDRGSRAFWSLAYALLFMVVPTAFEVALVCTALKTSAGLSFITIALSAVGSYIGWTYVISNWRAKFRDRFNKADSRVGGRIVDSLLNYETVKYFGREKHEENRIRAETDLMNRELKRLDQSMALLNFGQQVIFLSASVMCLYLSTCGVLAGTMTVGDMVLVDALLMQLYTPLSFLGMIYREVQTSTQNMQAMIALLDVTSSVKESPDAQPLRLERGTIEFRDVCFDSDGRKVLRNLSLYIPGGSTVAFVGSSGSGKTTLFRLLYRFYDPTSGTILLDGQPLPSLELQSLRRAIGVVPQDTVLFNDTVRYNIRYGRLDATDEEVEEAACLADIHESIMKMSQEYDTPVGERGVKLSGGEKQRVAIARVLLENAPILLADEATSALDSATEMRVMERLQQTSTRGRRRTIILIAHRLTTVMDADIIFVLDGKGGLAESGSHEELINLGGVYSELWRQQLQDTRMGEHQEEEEEEGKDSVKSG